MQALCLTDEFSQLQSYVEPQERKQLLQVHWLPGDIVQYKTLVPGILTLCGCGEDQGGPSVPSWGSCWELIQVRDHLCKTASITLLQNIPLRGIPAVYNIYLKKLHICHPQKCIHHQGDLWGVVTPIAPSPWSLTEGIAQCSGKSELVGRCGILRV